MKEEGIPMKMRKLVAGLAAAATLFGGLAFGVGAANAADADDGTLPVRGTTLTLNAADQDQLKGHSFAAFDLAWYVPVSDSGTVEVQTANRPTDASWSSQKYAEIQRALAIATKDNAKDDQYATEWNADGTPKTYRSDDAMAWAAQHMNRLDQSADAPWEGLTRLFAENLDITKLGSPAATIGGASQTATNSLTFENLQPGLYLVVDTSAPGNDWTNSIRMVASTALKIKGADGKAQELSNGQINLKNQKLPIHKQVVKPAGDGYEPQTKPDYTIGDTVTYELTSTLPTYTGYDKPGRIYQIIDTMSQGLTYNKVVSVKVGAGKMAPTTLQEVGADGKGDYSVGIEDVEYAAQQPNNQVSDVNGKPGTKITIDLANYVNETNNVNELADGGAKVTVIIEATLNSHAVVSTPGNATGNPNKVDLVYSNNSEDLSDKTTTPGGEVNVYTFKFQLKKISKDADAPLAGAQFVVQGPSRQYLQKSYDGKEEFKWLAVDKEDATVFTSDENGMIEGLDGLDAGTYTVTEIAPPAGYQSVVMPSFNFTITPTYEKDGSTMPDDANKEGVWGDHTLTEVSFGSPAGDIWKLVSQGDNNSAPEFQYTVTNVKSIVELPHTGAAGIAMFTVIGLLLAGAAGTVYLKSRKANALLRA